MRYSEAFDTTPERLRVRFVVSAAAGVLSDDRRTAVLESMAAATGTEIGQLEVAGSDDPRAFDLLVPGLVARRLRALLTESSTQLRLLRVERIFLERELGQTEEWSLREGRFRLVASTWPPIPKEPLQLNLFRPVVISLMVGCISWSCVEFVHLFAPDWNGTLVILASMLASIEAIYSYHLIRTRRVLIDNQLKFRLVELVLLLVILKAISYVGEPWAAVWAEIKNWPHNPLLMADLETLGSFALVFVLWLAATTTADDLHRLGEPVERSSHYTAPQDSLAGRFFLGGAVLVVIAGLTIVGQDLPLAVNWTTLLDLRRTAHPGPAANVLVYFLLGLLMQAHIRYHLLRHRWEAESIAVDPPLGGRWARVSLALLGLAALVGFLLPTRYSSGILALLSQLLVWLVAIVTYLVGLVLWLVGTLLSFLVSFLFGRPAETDPGVARPTFVRPDLAQPTAGPQPEWVLLLRSILFWGLVVGGILYVVLAYLRDHPELVEWVSRLKAFKGIRSWWASLRERLALWRKKIQQHLPRLPARRALPAREARPARRLFRLGALSPRERVLYFYWSILRRAERLGLARRRNETPYEYEATLDPHLDLAEDELGELTDAFLEARYSRHLVELDQARRVQAAWQAVRASLRAVRRRPENGSQDQQAAR